MYKLKIIPVDKYCRAYLYVKVVKVEYSGSEYIQKTVEGYLNFLSYVFNVIILELCKYFFVSFYFLC